ncbi:DUF3037 domain-containing protein [Flavobacterium subsaxonicum]|uniref:DUF3037 domain-containing protein n=1 Tax=Flavobacterium subsaxonicum WB 4.1-42 = DSM 21790 TaxID=1121898 RepID=A0A0A2MQQ7_9FLAO|nr:DUF3037 domain-containing protein [Flavobacterium subsaxonicum]KGO95017.1 hypothetical protein Q766_02590 [Flavobacterium subsaxonicum WB 4.1-42 = DSM 21790]
MQDKHLYEYAIIRVVPRVEREEFINAGVILFCKRQRFIKVLYTVNETKLLALCPDFDTQQLALNLESFERIARGAKNGGPIALFEAAERFRWLTAIRSSVIQTSRPHPGFSDNLEDTANRLFKNIVL